MLYEVITFSLLITTNLLAYDATLKIEKDVEQRARIALVDGSSTPNSTFFEILVSDLKVSGHFLARITSYNVCYTKLLRLGMDELSEDDKLVVQRARKIEKFLSQPRNNFV